MAYIGCRGEQRIFNVLDDYVKYADIEGLVAMEVKIGLSAKLENPNLKNNSREENKLLKNNSSMWLI